MWCATAAARTAHELAGCAVVDLRLPEMGDVYMTSGLLFLDGDHADRRPTVIVRAPQRLLDYLTVIQRSSTAGPGLKGVDHPRDPTLGLDKDGRWVLDYSRAARCDTFLASSQHVGHLDDEWLIALVEAWEDL